ncbi:MAG: hypothetical protein E5X51_12890 [Mesorhizobium sp.]|nr:MAG: hypothetical protein E5X51_12890 [Mesorhizobium sp.]
MARGLFQPHLKASIRHAFKVPVRSDRDRRRDISAGLGCDITWPNRRSLAAADQTFQGGSPRRQLRPQYEVARDVTRLLMEGAGFPLRDSSGT